MAESTLNWNQIEALWHRYRDQEHADFFSDQEWADYKLLFKRGPNFPDWLKDHWPDHQE